MCNSNQVRSLDPFASADHLAHYHQPSFLSNHVRELFFQHDHVAWSCPPVDHAPIPFFLADHAQEYAHVGKIHQHDVAFYMIGCLDHCTRDNHMSMAMSTLLPSSRQRKDISNAPSHDVPPLLCTAVSHGHAGTCSTASRT